MLRVLLTCVVAAGFLLGATCTPAPPEPLPPTLEQEPNNMLLTLQALSVSGGPLRLTGRIEGSDDVDLFLLGDFQAGDLVSVTISDAGTDAPFSLALFRSQPDALHEGQRIATLFEAADATAGTDAVVLDGTIRRSGSYALGIANSAAGLGTGGNYDVTLELQHERPILPAAAQIVLLDFSAGTFSTSEGSEVAIGPFNASASTPGLIGSNSEVLDQIVETVRSNFGGYDVRILRSDEDPVPVIPFSRVFFGPVISGANSLPSDGLGVAVDGIDRFNRNPADVALVFSGLFTPALFDLQTLAAEQLGTAMGNVATHEIGHLLGLQHAFEATDVMRSFSAPATLLGDLRFKRSIIDFRVFDTLETLLTQDATGYLHEVVGSTRRRADLTLTPGGSLYGVTATDFTSDGFSDLALSDRASAAVYIYVNNGDRSFSDPIPLNTAEDPFDVFAFDADLDNRSDLFTTNPPSGVISGLYRIEGGFTEPITFTAGTSPRAAAVGDFNDDLAPDLAVANTGSNDVTILLNDRSGSFQAASTIAVGLTSIGIATADFENDGRLDLALTSLGDDAVTILKGSGDGTFTRLGSQRAGHLPLGIAAADLDRDGDVDLAIVSLSHVLVEVSHGAAVSVLLNRGDGTFATEVFYSIEPGGETITAADLDGDGDVDLATSNAGDSQFADDPGSVSLLFNRGNGTFIQDVVLQAGFTPSGVLIGDLDERGLPDIAISNRGDETVSVFFNE